MDLLLRGRGADIGARAPLWLVRLTGAALAYCTLAVADRLGFSDALGTPPFAMRCGVMVLGALIAPTAIGALLWLLAGAAVTVSMIVAFTPIVQAPALHFVRSDSSSEPVDAVVVLSGSMNEDGRLAGPVLDRLLTGLGEARRRQVGDIAMSVLEGRRHGQSFTSEADQRALLALLAPDLTVRLVRDVASTRDEALQFKALANTYHWTRVALVTSPLHTRRACRTFETAGLAVTCVAAAPREYSVANLQGASARLNVFRDVLYETMATLLYSVRGWI